MSRQSRPDFGRLLRACAGGREDLLASLPSERTRFTSLGGVVVGTTVMAMLAMIVALHAAFAEDHPWVYVLVPVWGLFVLSIDRWLISDTWRGQGWFKLLPRFLLAVAIGLVVSESLVLSLFASAIDQQVFSNRIEAVSNLQSRLVSCNPVPNTVDTAPVSGDCDDYSVSVNDEGLRALLLTRQATQAEVAARQKSADIARAAQANAEARAREERAGQGGTDAGEGPTCRRLRNLADDARSQVSSAERELAEVSARLTGIQQRIGAAQLTYQMATSERVQRQVDEYRAAQRSVGLLERYQALSEVVGSNGSVKAMGWAVRLFVITVDCLPVLLRALSGRTAYDQLLDVTNAEQQRRQAIRSEAQIQSLQAEVDLQARLQEHDEFPDLQDSIRAGVEKALQGPPVINYDGWVGVEVDAGGEAVVSTTERSIVLSATANFGVAVRITADKLSAITEPLLLTGGIEQSRVEFVVEVDSDRPEFRRAGVPVTVEIAGPPGAALFEFRSVAPPASPSWMWIRISQGRRTVQNIELTVEAEAALDRR